MNLPSRANPPRYYQLSIPARYGWITENRRGAWYVHSQMIRHWRELTGLLARKEKLPPMPGGAYIIGELMFATARRRDANNWAPTAKAALDGLVDVGVFPDDNSKLITGPDMRLGPKVPVGAQRLVLHIWPHYLRAVRVAEFPDPVMWTKVVRTSDGGALFVAPAGTEEP